MRLEAQTIPHFSQRYPTVGDYFEDEGGTHFRISQMNPDYVFLVLLHELIEHHFTQKRGIPIEIIDAFDIQFEKEREEGRHTIEAEPGYDPRAPYRKEHEFATFIERFVALELGVNWDEYSKTIENL